MRILDFWGLSSKSRSTSSHIMSHLVWVQMLWFTQETLWISLLSCFCFIFFFYLFNLFLFLFLLFVAARFWRITLPSHCSKEGKAVRNWVGWGQKWFPQLHLDLAFREKNSSVKMLWNYLCGDDAHHGSSVFLPCFFALGLGISPELWLPQEFRVSSHCQSPAPGPFGSLCSQGWLFPESQFRFLHPPFLPHSCHLLCSSPHLWGAQAEQSDGRGTPLPRGSPGSAGQVFPLGNHLFGWDCPNWSKLEEKGIFKTFPICSKTPKFFPRSSSCAKVAPRRLECFFFPSV